MTTIKLKFARIGSDGSQLPTKGELTWTPTRRFTVTGTPDTVVLPLSFKVPVTSTAQFQVTVPASGNGWVWKVEERFTGLKTRRTYVIVPDVAEVDYADLVQVDPATLLPSAAPLPAWYGYVDAVEASTLSLTEAAEAAQLAAETATNTALSVATASVQVVTGNEVRPNVPLVLWIGGSVQPSNMGLADIWFQAKDTTPPSVPTGLAATNITTTAVTLTWTPSTDNSGVASYTVWYAKDAGGVLSATTTTPGATLTGLTPGTAYSISVTATDTVGNISAASASLSVSTEAPLGTPQHSIWGSGAYPFASAKYTDSPLTVANAFYSYGTSPDMNAWRVVGAKIWVPAGATLTQPAQVSAWVGANADLALTPAQTASISTFVAGAWNEVIFPAAIETDPGVPVYVGYRFPNGDYLAATGISSNFVQATDGSHIVFADDGPDLTRARYRYDGGATGQGMNGPGYSIDAIWDEGPGA